MDQGFDTNSNGVADTYIFDADQNGVIEVAAVDIDESGVVDTYAIDADQNGVLDAVAVDTNQNGVMDSFSADTDGDGVFETTARDSNDNGVLDHVEADAQAQSPGDFTIGGPNAFLASTSEPPSPLATTMQMAPAYGSGPTPGLSSSPWLDPYSSGTSDNSWLEPKPPDRDGDGVPDAEDRYPTENQFVDDEGDGWKNHEDKEDHIFDPTNTVDY